MGRERRQRGKTAAIRKSPDLNRAVYQRFLESDYPEALRLAEGVLEKNPTDAIAQAVREQCLQALRKDTVPAPASIKDAFDDDAMEDTIDRTLQLPDSELQTSPTLSLENKHEATRELYRLFLESEYAPALALAEDLLEREQDESILGMLRSIAHECRLSLEARRSVPVLTLPPATISEISPEGLDAHTAFVLAQIDGNLSIEEVADMSGIPLEEVLTMLDRFVAMGVLTLRPSVPSV